jgi:hypothetical protein
MKDKDLKVEETEVSHTLGGVIKYTRPMPTPARIHQSRWCRHRSGGVARSESPPCMCEEGGWGREGAD